MNYKLTEVFVKLRREKRKALIPYFTALYPSAKVFEQSVITAARVGADLIEIGLPFSDPIADGPVIQQSSHYALTHGFTIARMFRSIRRIRKQIIAPLVIMTYINPVLRRGSKRFLSQCKASGVNGLVIPDIIPEEGKKIGKAASQFGIAMNYLVTPNTSQERIRLIAKRTTGFIYLVSVAGVTGERKTIPSYLPMVARKIRRITDKPLCIGFGISTPEQAREVSRLCDGVIIGSALVKLTSGYKIAEFLKEVRKKI